MCDFVSKPSIPAESCRKKTTKSSYFIKKIAKNNFPVSSLCCRLNLRMTRRRLDHATSVRFKLKLNTGPKNILRPANRI